MKKLLLCAVFFSLSAYTMEKNVTLPPAKILKEKLSQNGFESFVRYSNIDKQLANKQLHPDGIELKVSLCLHTYTEKLNASLVLYPEFADVFQKLINHAYDNKQWIIDIILESSTKN